MKTRYIIILILVMVSAVFGLKQVWTMGRPDASSVLIKSAEKAHNATYSGLVETSTMYYGREINGLARVYHKSGSDRMEYISEPVKGTVVVTKDDETRTFHPSVGRLLVSPNTAGDEERKKVELLLRNYNAEIAGDGTVANRKALIVDITPKRRGNPSKRMWVDKDTFVVLRQEDRSSTGKVKSRMAFKEIDFSSDIPKSKFTIHDKAGSDKMVKVNQPMSQGDLSKRLGFTVTRPEYVPKGYIFTGSQLYRCQCNCDHYAAHLRYTDGLNSISIFQTSRDVGCESSMCKVNGKKNRSGCEVGNCRQAHIGRTSLKDKNVIIVADLPDYEIERIAGSIK